MQINNLTTFNL